MITYQEESYKAMFTSEFRALTEEHWQEVGGFNKEKVKLSVNWDMYKALGKAGNLILYIIKYTDKVIGYCLFIKALHPHYRNTLIAENDILYLIPSFRKGYTGYKFLKYCVEDLKKKVDIILLSMKVKHSYEVIAKRLGFTLMDCLYRLEI